MKTFFPLASGDRCLKVSLEEMYITEYGSFREKTCLCASYFDKLSNVNKHVLLPCRVTQSVTLQVLVTCIWDDSFVFGCCTELSPSAQNTVCQISQGISFRMPCSLSINIISCVPIPLRYLSIVANIAPYCSQSERLIKLKLWRYWSCE